MYYQILVNPRAGGGRGESTWHMVAKCLNQLKISYQVRISKYPGHPQKLARTIAQNHLATQTCLIVIGGDGTLHESISGLLQLPLRHQLPVGYIPAGTGNDFARGYGISSQPLQALKQILLNHSPRLINIGRYRDTGTGHHGIFLNNLGIGFDASIVQRTNSSERKQLLNHLHLGQLSYVANAIHVVLHQPTFAVNVSQPGTTQTFQQAFLLIASNHPYIGGGIKAAPDESVIKPELELVVVEKKSLPTFLWSIGMFASGHLIKSHLATVFRGQQLTYEISSPQYGQTDGETIGPIAFRLQLTCGQYPMWQLPLNEQKS